MPNVIPIPATSGWLPHSATEVDINVNMALCYLTCAPLGLQIEGRIVMVVSNKVEMMDSEIIGTSCILVVY